MCEFRNPLPTLDAASIIQASFLLLLMSTLFRLVQQNVVVIKVIIAIRLCFGASLNFWGFN
jgi:hypothetical protein